MKKLILILLLFSKINLNGQNKILKDVNSPVIFKGDEKTAYRDPAVLFHNDQFFLFFTLVKTIDEEIYSFTATSKSSDLINWSPINILTPRDQNLNFCSPGNVVRYKGKWLLCLQTYPRPDYISGDKVRYGSDDSQFLLLRVKMLRKLVTS